MESGKGAWVLGYGSLIFKPPPHYTHRVPALIYGYERRFWQESSDHRGTVESPGRVATLVPYDAIINDPRALRDYLDRMPDPKFPRDLHDLVTVGVVYYIPHEFRDATRVYLDHREKNGYTLHEVEVHLVPSEIDLRDPDLKVALDRLPVSELTGKSVLESTVYIGASDNPAYVNVEPIERTATIIAHSVGPSGANYEYLTRLHDSLSTLEQEHHLHVKDLYLDELLEVSTSKRLHR